MKRGQTIVAEREKVETASERMHARQKTKHKRTFAIIVVLLILAALVIAAIIAWRKLIPNEPTKIEATPVTPQAMIVDEASGNNSNITTRLKEYVANLETDLKDSGYKVARVTLPAGKSREIYVDVEGRPYYFKVNTDRGAGVTAEDISRMIKYLDGKDIKPSKYVDVRVEGKAFYL